MYRFHVYDGAGNMFDCLEHEFSSDAKARKYARGIVEDNALVGVERCEVFSIPTVIPKHGLMIDYLTPVLLRGKPFVAKVDLPESMF